MKPYFEDNLVRIYNKDCRHMDELPDNSVQCVVTSPPYWGLRKYSGLQDLIWGDNHCEHEWGIVSIPKSGGVGDYEVGRVGNAMARTASHEAKTSGICSLCGAWKGQYGLEPTPEMYIEHTVEILRGIRRVLRKDGVVFWNIGDSYSGSGQDSGKTAGQKRSGGTGIDTRSVDIIGVGEPVTRAKHPILKPKDLCLIPFRVAQEVQKPYYTGKIKDEKDRIWLASMIDGEGCLFIHKRKIGQDAGGGYKRKHDTYGAGLEVANTHKAIVERCQYITKIGSICRVERETKTKQRNIPLYRWNVRTNECRQIIKEAYPYLVGKQHEARLLLGCPSSGVDAEKAHISLMALHNGKEACIDFPAPESLYELGWWVRSVIIWSKNNPMPESVTDRPTESHEYILMLTKSARYYWDADAVREQNTDPQRTNFVSGARTHGLNLDRNDNDLGERSKDFIANGRNIRSVWEFPTQPYPQAHFAVFPEKLPEICIKAATPEAGCCSKCGAPWERILDKKPSAFNIRVRDAKAGRATPEEGYKATQEEVDNYPGNHPDPGYRQTTGWQPTCKCNADKVPSMVLDPFMGAGTTLWVAKKLGRRAVGYELSEEYCQLALERNRQSVMELKV